MANVNEATDAAGNSSTIYGLSIGQTVQGQIGFTGDTDWYRVSLVAGQTYTFGLVGTGLSNTALQDSFLNLRNSSGTILSSNDDGGPGLNSTVTFTAATSGTYYLDVESYPNPGQSNTGQYTLSATAGTRASYDADMAAGALLREDLSWAAPGSGTTITYGFRDTAATYTTGSDIATFTHVSSAEISAIETIMQFWSSVSGLHFTEVNPGGYTDNATVLFGNYNDSNDGAGAFAFFPGSTASTNSAGDVWLNVNSVSTTALPFGSYSFFAIMHEVGHTLGLSHPGDYNAAPGVAITYASNAQFIQDSEQYSVMSYFSGSNTAANLGGYAETPMLYDVYAAQELYGANMTTRTGDTIYGFGSNAGSVFDFSSNPDPAVCIWDAGGTDTLNCSGFASTQLINLNAGSFSNIGGLTANVSIAFGAVIENAVGGSGNDTIIGNSADNRLTGNAGADTISGGDGNDTIVATTSDGNDVITGENGFDTLDYTQVLGPVQIDQLDGVTTGSAGNDVLRDVIEQVEGTNFNDVLSGGNGGDVLDGNGGNDQFFGNNGDDLMRGGDGDDTFYFSVNDGNDRLLGGNGFDILDYSSLPGVVQVNQLAGTTTGTAGNDVLLDVFEMVIGTAYGDVLSGGNGINSLKGNGGDDQIFANGGDDYVSGGPGNDTITLGPGNDTVDFRKGDGIDTITDFVAGGTDDQIDLRFYTGLGITTFAQLQASGRLVTVSGHAEINLDGGDKIILANVADHTLLTSMDFVLTS